MSRRPSVVVLAGVAIAACAVPPPRPAPPPVPEHCRPGEPVDLALFGRVRSWMGPWRQAHRGDRWLHAVDLVRDGSDYVVPPTAPPAETEIESNSKSQIPNSNGDSPETGDVQPANIGVEWEEAREFDTVTVHFDPEAPLPDPAGAVLEVWGGQGGKDEGMVGSLSPHEGGFWAPDARRGVDGPVWTWRLKPVKHGTHKVRVVFGPATAIRVASLRVQGRCRWNLFDVVIEARGPVQLGPEMVRIHNGFALAVDTWRQSGGTNLAIRLLAPVTIQANSPDDALVTLAQPVGATFGLYELRRPQEIRLPAGAVARLADYRLLMDTPDVRKHWQVARDPEQTWTSAMANVPSKVRAKWLALSPPLYVHKWAVRPEGNVFPRKDAEFTVEFATGAEPDFARREPQHVEEDHLPVLIAEWAEGALRWRQEYVCVPLESGGAMISAETGAGPRHGAAPPAPYPRGDEATALVTRLTVVNAGAEPADAFAWLRFRRKDGDAGVSAAEGLFSAGGAPVALAAATGWEAEPAADGAWRARRRLAPGASAALELRLPSPGHGLDAAAARAALAAVSFDQAREWTVACWRRRLAAGAQFRVPEEPLNRLWRSLLIHQSAWGERDPATGLYQPNVAAFQYGPVGNEGSQMAKALDLYGDHDLAGRYLEALFDTQGAHWVSARVPDSDGAFIGSRPNYVFNTGFILWNAARHWRLTRDEAWLGRAAPKLAKACEWIARMRRETMAGGEGGGKLEWPRHGAAPPGEDKERPIEYGLFPACSLEDEWTWHYWTMTNAYLAGGMRDAAAALAEIEHPGAGRWQAEAADYAACVASAARRAAERCPVVPLRDGTWVPFIPKHLHRRGRSPAHYEAELGALHLVSCDILPPDDPLIDATLDFHEDELYLTEAPDGRNILSLARMEEDWFNLGGYPKAQPYLLHTPQTYVRRDEPKHALRSFYNTLAAQNYHDINAFPEHICWDGAADCKTYEEAMALQQFRELLVHEEGDELWLAPAASRHWFADGQEIAVERSPTDFGTVSYTIRSAVARGRIVAEIDLGGPSWSGRGRRPLPPRAIRLRLRHPEGRPMRRITVEGAGDSGFDATREWIVLRRVEGRVRVEAEY